MLSLNEEISKLLNPNKKISLIMNDKLIPLKPVMSVSMLYEVLKETTEEFQQKIISMLNQPGVVIFGGCIYVKTGEVDIQDRIARIFTLYKENIDDMLGEKKALIEIYSKLKPHQIVHLIQQNIVFVMRKLANSNEKGVVAIKYVPEFEVTYKNGKWKFPEFMLGVHISPDLKFDRPEVIYDGIYDHMFVYMDKKSVGQRICLGSLEGDSTIKLNLQQRDFATSLSFWMAQAEQIIRYGYNEKRSFTPVHSIDNPKFQKYKIK